MAKECQYGGMYEYACKKQEVCLLLKELRNGENIWPTFFQKRGCPGEAHEEAVSIMGERFPGADLTKDPTFNHKRGSRK